MNPLTFEEWRTEVLQALHRLIMEAGLHGDPELLWWALGQDVLPQLDKQRAYVFFKLGSGLPEALQPERLAALIFEEYRQRQKRGGQITVEIPAEAEPQPEEVAMNGDTIIEELEEVAEEDLHEVKPKKF